MAKQSLNWGAQPSGIGGDTFFSGSVKLQANDDELYSFLGADAQGNLTPAGFRDELDLYSKSEVYTKAEADTLFSIDEYLKYMPIPYPKNTPPTGSLVLMGQAISEAMYPILYRLYGPTLPDMRAYGIRGLDYGRGIDSGRIVLSEQGDAIRNITGDITFHAGNSQGLPASQVAGADGVFNGLNQLSNYSGSVVGAATSFGVARFNASNVVPTALENRVKNIAFLYIVKAG